MPTQASSLPRNPRSVPREDRPAIQESPVPCSETHGSPDQKKWSRQRWPCRRANSKLIKECKAWEQSNGPKGQGSSETQGKETQETTNKDSNEGARTPESHVMALCKQQWKNMSRSRRLRGLRTKRLWNLGSLPLKGLGSLPLLTSKRPRDAGTCELNFWQCF